MKEYQIGESRKMTVTKPCHPDQFEIYTQSTDDFFKHKVSFSFWKKQARPCMREILLFKKFLELPLHL